MKALRLPAQKDISLLFVILYVVTFLFILSFLLFLWLPIGENAIKSFVLQYVDPKFFIWLAAGFLAQLIDGALGMAYGISSTTFLLTTGVSPAVASASVHLAEIFTTAASGLSHWRFGNVDKQLFKMLLALIPMTSSLGKYSSQDYNKIQVLHQELIMINKIQHSKDLSNIQI
jgi:hypothetical protein